MFRTSTQFSLIIYRTQLFVPDDMPDFIPVKDRGNAQPVSAYLGRPAATTTPGVAFRPISEELMERNIAAHLGFLFRFGPAAPNEAEIRVQLARLPVGTGRAMAHDDKFNLQLAEEDPAVWAWNPATDEQATG